MLWFLFIILITTNGFIIPKFNFKSNWKLSVATEIINVAAADYESFNTFCESMTRAGNTNNAQMKILQQLQSNV